MKNLTLIILCSVNFILLFSCGKPETPQQHYDRTTEYQLSTDSYVPDSNKAKMADFITKTVSAASYHLAAGDYEDPEDVIEEATITARSIYSVEEPSILIIQANNQVNEVRMSQFTPKLQQIYDSLKYNQ